MSNIILHGGLLRIASAGVGANPAVKFLSVNIALNQSNAWLNGTLFIDKKSYYRLLPSRDNLIEIKHRKDVFLLTVNDKVIYHNNNLFGYTIDVSLNKAISDMPYAKFFRYY
jgi:hypothetical protein